MDNNLVDVFVLALVAIANPSLLAAVTVMLLLPNPKRLMLGYLLGAYVTSITFGLAIVFSLHGSGAVKASKNALSPAEDIAVGVVLLAIAAVLATGRDAPLRQRRERRKQAKHKAGKIGEPWSQRLLGRGSARLTFVVGAVLSFPGVSYLDALDHIVKLDAGTIASVLLVVGFCVMQQLLLELPLLGYLLSPDRTRHAVTRFRAWLRRRGRHLAIAVAAVLGVVLIARGAINAS